MTSPYEFWKLRQNKAEIRALKRYFNAAANYLSPKSNNGKSDIL